MVVDSHVHLLPPRLQARIREFLVAHAGAVFAYPTDHGEVVESLAIEGIAEVWSLPYARRPGVADGLNDAMASIARSSTSVSIVGGATVHPGDDDPVRVVRRAVEDLGLRVLKLHCSVGEYTPDDSRLDVVWEYVSVVCVPVVVHAGHAPSGHTVADELARVATVAARYPDARIVVAHCGHRAVDAALDIVVSNDHVYADLTPVVSEPVALPADRAEQLSPRLLFGSDAPNAARKVRDDLDDLRRLALSAEAMTAITGGNARRLIDQIAT